MYRRRHDAEPASPQMKQSNPRCHVGKVKSRLHLSTLTCYLTFDATNNDGIGIDMKPIT